MKRSKVILILTMVAAFAALGLSLYGVISMNSRSADNNGSAELSVYEKLENCYRQVREKTDFVPDIAIVLGSGLGDLADRIDVLGEISYADIDGFPVSTAPGHEGKYIYGTLGGRKVICMKGRIHLYEGYSATDVVLPIRLMQQMGAETLILSNAAGGLNSDFEIGDLMLITDHISLFARNPLMGQNVEELGVRFPDMSHAYDPQLMDIARASASRLGIDLQEGVYVQVTGPSYETPAETALLRSLGADAVGMSTVIETIAARHAGMRVCAVSCITNIAFDISSQEPDEADVIEAGNQAAEKFQSLIVDIVENIDV